jgi:hypothetical protein
VAKSGLIAKEDWQSMARNAQTTNNFFIWMDFNLLARKTDGTLCPSLTS